MINTHLLQGKMREKNYTIKTLANDIGLSSTGLFNKIHNKKEFVVSEIQSICQLLGISESERNEIFFAKNVELKSTKQN